MDTKLLKWRNSELNSIFLEPRKRVLNFTIKDGLIDALIKTY